MKTIILLIIATLTNIPFVNLKMTWGNQNETVKTTKIKKETTSPKNTAVGNDLPNWNFKVMDW